MSMRLLAVDDQEFILDLLVDFLTEDHLFLVDQANNGLEALKHVKLYEYKLILLDYRMPLMNGSEFLENLRSTKGLNQDTPVLFITANPDDTLPLLDLYEKVFLIMKPLDANELSNKIRDVLG
jgi:DNA-binding response OmpR family regulator